MSTDVFEASDVHHEEYTSENSEQRLIYDDGELRHFGAEPDVPSVERISIVDISEIRRDIDRSQAGFRRISYAFVAFAVLFSVVALPFLLTGVLFDPIGGGAILSAVLCWYGAATIYRMERGPLDVLEIKAHGEWYQFYTPKGRAAFDELVSHIRSRRSNQSITLHDFRG